MTMQRRNYELIARTLRNIKPPTLGQTREEVAIANIQWERTVGAFLGACKADNARFDGTRFLRACGVED